MNLPLKYSGIVEKLLNICQKSLKKTWFGIKNHIFAKKYFAG
jgi:hypothetical protein